MIAALSPVGSAAAVEAGLQLAPRIDAIADAGYIGGMPRAVVQLAAEVRQQLERTKGAPLGVCAPSDPRTGSVIATGAGGAAPLLDATADPLLRELHAMLGSKRQRVRDIAAYIIGEIGPDAAALAPALDSTDDARPAWFTHALTRVRCQHYRMSAPLQSIPRQARAALLGRDTTPGASRTDVQLVSRLLPHADLQWPDEFFASALDLHDFDQLHGEADPLDADWIAAIAQRVADPSAPMRLRVDLAALLQDLGRAARPAADALWNVAQQADDELAAPVAEVVLHSAGAHAVDAAAMLLGRFDYDVDLLPDALCTMEGAAERLGPVARARLADDDDWRHAARVAERLACIDPVGSAAALRDALRHPSWEVQLAAVRALTHAARTDAATRAALQQVQREHWSGLLRSEAGKALDPPPKTDAPDSLANPFKCFHRCLNDHLRRCGDEHGIVDGRYVSPTLGELDVEWQRAHRVPAPAGFPLDVVESRPGYGTSTYLRVDGGWLYGTDRWHYDGAIAFVGDDGTQTPIGAWGDDAVAIIATPHFGTTMLGQSLSGVGEGGLLASLERSADGWRMVRRTVLPSPPWGWAFAPDGTLLVADPYEAVAVHADGRIEALQCPARAPERVPRTLLALAQRAPAALSELKRREAADAVAVHEAAFVALRAHSEHRAAHRDERRDPESLERARERLDAGLDALLAQYLRAGRAESALAMLDGLPAGTADTAPGRRFQLYAAAGRADDARAALGRIGDATDVHTLKLHAALALAEGRSGDARTALARIAVLDAKRRSDTAYVEQERDHYLDLLQQLAAGRGAAARSIAADRTWPAPVGAHLAGAIDEQALAVASHARDGRIDRDKLCEALFYKALQLAVSGKRRAARSHLRAAADLCIEHDVEHSVAVVALAAARERTAAARVRD